MAFRVNKFHARKTVVDGIIFDSKKEAARYTDLRLLKLAGEVWGFVIHPSYRLIVNGQDIGKMTLDFEVIWSNGEITWEDVKAGITAQGEAYRLRRKVLEASLPPMQITELL